MIPQALIPAMILVTIVAVFGAWLKLSDHGDKTP